MHRLRLEARRARRASDSGFMACQAAVMIGPEKLPGEPSTTASWGS
jgi:hypothetical protein